MVKRDIDNALTGKIITLICETWGVTRPELVSKSRRRPLPWARAMLCWYLCYSAGHDSISCAALLNRTYESISHYITHYVTYTKTFVPFKVKDERVKEKIKEMVKK